MEIAMQYGTTTVLLMLMIFCSACSTCDSVYGARVESNSNQYVAFTEESTCGPLLSESDSFVRIEQPYYIRGHRIWTATKTIAGGKVSPEKLTLSWKGNDHLLIGCRCRRDAFDFAIGQWRDITIVYEFSP
jgi:hypothetical protein